LGALHSSFCPNARSGRILSTITATAQVLAHLRDGAQIKIRVSRNMETTGDLVTDEMTFTIVDATNEISMVGVNAISR
jgi:hypothetical protein